MVLTDSNVLRVAAKLSLATPSADLHDVNLLCHEVLATADSLCVKAFKGLAQSARGLRLTRRLVRVALDGDSEAKPTDMRQLPKPNNCVMARPHKTGSICHTLIQSKPGPLATGTRSE
jgi:hypothetical protein